MATVPRGIVNRSPFVTGWSDSPPITKYDWSNELLLWSEPHWRVGTRWSGGGDFLCSKRYQTHQAGISIPCRKVSTGQVLTMRLRGVSPISTAAHPSDPLSGHRTKTQLRDDVASYYATGYARTRPGRPQASLGQFIGELGSLPALPFKGAFKALSQVPIRKIPVFLLNGLSQYRKLGSEYLNVQFGWVPFVKDVREMYNLWNRIDSELARLIRENGRGIRRRATIESEKSSQFLAGPSSHSAFHLVNGASFRAGWHYGGGSSVYSRVQETYKKVWFVGKYQYYIPDLGSSQWSRRAKLALFGGIPTPELLWELMPWSWLIDWFSNVGDVVSNMSANAVDNLVTQYSFTMKHTEVKTTATSQSFCPSSPFPATVTYPAVQHTFSSSSSTVEKLRVGGGNPFGLDVQLTSLTNYQLSILAALGLSRSSVR